MPRRRRAGKNRRHSRRPEEPDHRGSIGIIRRAALCRLCRHRHKRHAFACRRLLAWYREGTDIDRAIDQLSAYLGHAKVSDTYWYLTGLPELLELAGRRFEQFTLPQTGDSP
jgi:hypothetical protein